MTEKKDVIPTDQNEYCTTCSCNDFLLFGSVGLVCNNSFLTGGVSAETD